jgi:hypothetical protein
MVLTLNREFGAEQDTVELHIYNVNNQLLRSLYNFSNYTVQNTKDNSSLYDTLYLNPEEDLKSFGYSRGKYIPVYNFYSPLFLSTPDRRFLLKKYPQIGLKLELLQMIYHMML